MPRDDATSKKAKDSEHSTRESLAAEKDALHRRVSTRAQQRTLRPEDIGVVRVQFTVPASRLFGPGSLTLGGDGAPDVLNDGDPTDDIFIFDWPPGDADKVIRVPWPPGSEPDE